MREIIFDTETTGRDPEGGNRVVEIGCVEVINYSPTGRTWHTYVNPEREVPEEVVRVHGLTSGFLSDKPLFADIVDPFMDFVGEAQLVAHNAEFDRRFINAELKRLGRAEMPSDCFVDTLAIARKKFPGAANSLDALARRFQLDRYGFDLSARTGSGGHGALVDAKMLAEIYLQLNGGREQRLAFEAEPQASGNAETPAPRARRAARPTALAVRGTTQERAAHAAFVAEMGAQALWLKFGK